MKNQVSVRELRNAMRDVLHRVEAGERLTVTVDSHPVAEIVPLSRHKVVSGSTARHIASHHSADPGLRSDLQTVFIDTTDDI